MAFASCLYTGRKSFLPQNRYVHYSKNISVLSTPDKIGAELYKKPVSAIKKPEVWYFGFLTVFLLYIRSKSSDEPLFSD